MKFSNSILFVSALVACTASVVGGQNLRSQASRYLKEAEELFVAALEETFGGGSEEEEEMKLSHGERYLREMEELELYSILKNPECTGFVSNILNAGGEIIDHHSPSSVAAYVCNPIERKILRQKLQQFEADVAEASADGEEDSNNSCFLAMEKLILRSKSILDKSLKNTKACKEEVTKELAQDEAMGGSRRRRSLQGLQQLGPGSTNSTIKSIVNGTSTTDFISLPLLEAAAIASGL